MEAFVLKGGIQIPTPTRTIRHSPRSSLLDILWCIFDMQQLQGETRLKYKGVARVHLDVLHFYQPLGSDPIRPDPRRVEYLKGRFQKEGCNRLPVLRHIPVIIDQESLDAAMRDSCVSAERLLKGSSPYPHLSFPKGFQLENIHGRHRIQAGQEILPPKDRWWTVDLYLSGRVKRQKTIKLIPSSLPRSQPRPTKMFGRRIF